jgi:hypothetical protein
MELVDLKNRFKYHVPDDQKKIVHEHVRAKLLEFALWLNEEIGDCREKSLAVTSLEDAMMWANAAIARHELPVNAEA